METKFKIFPPLIGILTDVVNVPDPVFAEKMVGDGIAIDPFLPQIYAPFAGVITNIHQGKYAITIRAENGISALIHIGLDTVKLNGRGFNIIVNVGEVVACGQILGEIDLDILAKNATSLLSPIIFPDLDVNTYYLNKIIADIDSIANITALDDEIMTINKIESRQADLMNVLFAINEKQQLNEEELNKRYAHTKYKLIKSKAVTIKIPQGIHARPASLLSTKATELSDDFEVLIEKNGNLANLKSVVSILSLAINYDDIIFFFAKSDKINQQLILLLENLNESNTKSSTTIATSIQHNDSGDRYFVVERYDDGGGKYYGVSAAKGQALGFIVIRAEPQFDFQESAQDAEHEVFKYTLALNVIKKKTEEKFLNFVNAAANNSECGILSAHLALLADPQIDADIKKLIREQHKTAAFAVSEVYNKYCKMLAVSENKILVDRQDDLRDLCRQILTELCQKKVPIKPTYTKPTILITHSLTPHDLINRDKNIVGVISVFGGSTSHVAILAKSYKLPLLIGVNESILTKAKNGKLAILDANDGYIDLEPSNKAIAEVTQKLAIKKKIEENQLQNAKFAAITEDNILIKCYANVNSVEEVKKAAVVGSDGIGLLRTEFIFLNRKTEPSIDEQYKIYSDMFKQVDPQYPIIIRVLDIGSDKQVSYLDMIKEVNPGLGLRGLRLLLYNKQLLHNQLSAILQLKRDIKIMLPMVTSLAEVREFKVILAELMQQMRFKVKVEVGIMVEVPSVVLLSEAFAKEVDFFSIGTNDLTQYTLATDREHPKFANNVNYLNPAIIHSIAMIVNGAKRYNRHVAVCGVMASETIAIPLLLGLGVKELSMNIVDIPNNKEFIRSLNYANCAIDANNCKKMTTTLEIKEYLQKRYL